MNRTIIYITFIWIFFVQDIAVAQNPDSNTSRKYGWIDVGLRGFKSPLFFGEGGGVLALSYLSGSNLFTGRILFRAGYLDFYMLGAIAPEPQELYEFSVLYGKAINTDFLFVSGSSGISIVSGKYITLNQYDFREKEQFVNIGLPLEVQMFLTPLPVLAIGVKCTANLNYKYAFSEGFVCMRYGILRHDDQ